MVQGEEGGGGGVGAEVGGAGRAFCCEAAKVEDDVVYCELGCGW
jgi:hypothetical protein